VGLGRRHDREALLPPGHATGEVEEQRHARAVQVVDAGEIQCEADGLALDLARVDYLDSSGVTLLFNLARRVARRQQRFAVVAPAEAHVAEILSLSGATEALALHESLDDALRGLAT